jgi:hypothetical protein
VRCHAPLKHDEVIAGLDPSEAARLLQALSTAAIVAHPQGPNTVRILAKRNRSFAIAGVALVVREVVPGRSDMLSARHEEPIGEHAPASQLG